MANRYTYQFNGSFKPKMSQIEGTVFIGTGGMLNYPDAYPIFPVATGATGVASQTGSPRFTMVGQSAVGVPTGWQGGFSGCQGLLGAGVAGIVRVSTGLYNVRLQDDWVRLDSIQVDVIHGGTGTTGVNNVIVDHSVGLGNTIASGGQTGWLGPGVNPKNTVFIQFTNTNSGVPMDLGPGSAFTLDIRVRDSLNGPQ